MVFYPEKKQLAILSVFPSTSYFLPMPFLFVHMGADSSHTVCLLTRLLSHLSGRLLSVRSVTSPYNGVWSPTFTGAGQGQDSCLPMGFSGLFFTHCTFSLHLDVVKQMWCVRYSNGLEDRSQQWFASNLR